MKEQNQGGEAHQIKVGLQRAAERIDVKLARVISAFNAGWLVGQVGDSVYATDEQFAVLNAAHGRPVLEWEEAPAPTADDPAGPQPKGSASSSNSDDGEGLRGDVPGAPILDDEDDMHRMVGGPAQTPLKDRKKK